MTNYEKIKNMSVEEMAKIIFNSIRCNLNCPMYSACMKTKNVVCSHTVNIEKWLESEVYDER